MEKQLERRLQSPDLLSLRIKIKQIFLFLEADLNKDGALSIRPQQRRTPVVTPPLACGRGLMGGVTRGIRKQPVAAAAKALTLRLWFFSAGSGERALQSLLPRSPGTVRQLSRPGLRPGAL